ncbi:PilZ domain-containing protein [Pseudomonas sp. LS44]|uniref:PilZ domain-containing protein n=1 Tax=Pseudomonas sp. LS44 TaxID=1357074 RepID=UPI00215B0729|nr:PilZ domain-containing protein [Pseudomonas sp. LS44]UVE16914.1 PilZ domain-containing protein [Pseudomonas sp. LS44]
MQDESILTHDELQFIRELQNAPRPADPPTTALLVDGGERTKELLARLAVHEHLTIEAQIDNQRVSFPVHLVEDEFHALHVQLGLPTIVEQAAANRPWRLPFPEPLALLDADGKASGLWLHSLSQSGLLVEVRDRPIPKRFTLWMPVPDAQPIELRGTLIRETEQHLIAYRLSQHKVRQHERLRKFILDHHPQLNELTDGPL